MLLKMCRKKASRLALCQAGEAAENASEIAERLRAYNATGGLFMNDGHNVGIPRVHLAWGRRGAHDAAERGEILVVVDTLRFSTAAATAVHHGALIYPCATDEALYTALALRVGGEVALHHAAAPTPTRFSLSPRSFLAVEPGARIVLPSPNGSTCAQYGSLAPAL